MEPNSVLLIVLVLLAVGGLFVAMLRFGHLLVRVVAAALVVVLAAVAGMAFVNDYYGYYRSWSQLSADLTGSYSAFATTTVQRRTPTSGHGVVEPVTFPGATSKINRPGYVYLPPQYFQKQYASTTFPVIELLHGSPGHPLAWIVQLNIAKVMDELIAHHEIGPMILVLPTMNSQNTFEDGVNGPDGQDDTYLTTDVRADVLRHFRASPVAAEWGIAGYSSGGYATANLALRHRDLFGAAGVMDGYFRPQDGPAQAALGSDPQAQAANDPLAIAAHLPAAAAPLPAFWVSVGTGDSGDLAGADAFVKALDGVEQVSLFKAAGAGHNFYDWAGAVPRMVSWMWTQLAPPQLRVQFPITGAVHQGALFPPQPQRVYVRNPGRRNRHRSANPSSTPSTGASTSASTTPSSSAARTHASSRPRTV